MELKDSAFGAPVSKADKAGFDDVTSRSISGTAGVNDGIREQGYGLDHDCPIPIKRKRGKVGFPKEGGGLPQPRGVVKSAFFAEPVSKKVLTAEARARLPKKSFAGPHDSYPIEDRRHAANALARVANKSPALKARVRRKVHDKYPSMGQG